MKEPGEIKQRCILKTALAIIANVDENELFHLTVTHVCMDENNAVIVTRHPACDEIQYFDITSPLVYFSSSILSCLRRVRSFTVSSERRKMVQVLKCFDVSEVDAVILLMFQIP